MGNYKVPQNVEAEDKILGPLTLRQFIYVIIGIAYGALMFAIFRQFIIGFIILGLPPALFMFIMGVGRRDDQTFESYFFAVIQYWITPHVRFWEKEHIAEVFKIEIPPPKPEEIHADPRQVHGQLEKLASIVDTRGWASKGAEVQEAGTAALDMNERLGAESFGLPKPSASATISHAEDIFDVENNANAQNLNTLIANSSQSVRDEAIAMMTQRAQAAVASVPDAQIPKPGTQAQPAMAPPVQVPQTPPMTPQNANAIIKLATEGGDLSITALAAQAAQAIAHNQELLEGQTVTIQNANTSAA